MRNKMPKKNKNVIFAANRGFALTNSRTLLIKHFLSAGWGVVAVTKNDKYAKQLSEMGVLLEPILFNRGGVSIQNDLSAFLTLLRIYRKYQPTLIHNFNAKPVIFGNLVGHFVSESKIINTITGLGHAFILGGMVRHLAAVGYKFSLRRCSFTIFQNSDDLQLFVENRWVPKEKVRLIATSGVDTEHFYPRNFPMSGSDSLKILMVGRLIWQKGVREFVEAAQIVKERYPNVCFQLAGERDPIHPDAVGEQWLQEVINSGVVEFLGYIQNMAEKLRQTDIFILPSYREGGPRVLLEAASCGIPVITTDVPGCREVVIDGVTGRVVPFRNSNALAEATCELLNNPELRQRMGKAGRQHMELEFDIRTITNRYLDIYREIGIDI